MGKAYDATGMKPEVFGPIPKGTYNLEIIEAEEGTTKETGRYKVTVDYKVIDYPEYNGRKIKFHTIVFMGKGEKGAGISLHYLKTIEQPFEGKFMIEPKNWIGKKLMASVGIDGEYNKINSVMPYDYTKAQDVQTAQSEADIPF